MPSIPSDMNFATPHDSPTVEAAASIQRARANGPDSDVRISPALASIRHQLAIVRSVADELEASIPASRFVGTSRAQVIEELIRLGCVVFETACALARLEEVSRGQD